MVVWRLSKYPVLTLLPSPSPGKERFSIPFFFDPHYNTPIAVLPEFANHKGTSTHACVVSYLTAFKATFGQCPHLLSMETTSKSD